MKNTNEVEQGIQTAEQACASCGSRPAITADEMCPECQHAVDEHGALRSSAYAVLCNCENVPTTEDNIRETAARKAAR